MRTVYQRAMTRYWCSDQLASFESDLSILITPCLSKQQATHEKNSLVKGAKQQPLLLLVNMSRCTNYTHYH